MSKKGRSKKQQEAIQEESLDFAALDRMSNGFMQNPYWMNSILKQLLGYPQEYTRAQVLQYIKNPIQNELALKKVHQYLMNLTMFYKRLVHYFATILTFDYIILPINADEEEMKSDSFKRSYKKILNWLEKFKVKEELTNVMKAVMGEDAAYYYLRESENTITLQRMPTDYCKIVAKTELGYQYAFDLNYFNNPGVNIDNFAPEFKEYYVEFLRGRNSSLNWVILDPEKAYCFKFDENTAAVIPPFSGLFIDALEISEFKQLIKTRTVLDALLLLVMKIPLKDSKDLGSSKNPLLLSLDMVEKFHKLVKSNLPADGVNLVSTPMDLTSVDLKNAGESRNSVIGYAESAFYRNAGVSSLLFESDKKVGSVGVAMSAKTDEAFVLHMYRQFERFINFNLSKISGKNKFKILFIDNTIFNREDKLKLYLQAGQSGFPKSFIGASMGLTPGQIESLTNFENTIGLVDKLKPLMSSHTQSLNEGGRPPKDENKLGDKGLEARDLETNKERA